MTEIVIRVPGEPIPQNQGKIGRWKAKDGREGATIRQPAKVRNFKVELQERMLRAAIDAGMSPDFQGTFFGNRPLAMSLVAVFSCPVSQHRKTKPVERRPHTGRYGNLDNLIKPVADAGEGVLWEDDGQICRYFEPFGKYVAAQGEAPYLEIRVRALDMSEY
jgi:Holliday junction resolvase RusA-like endonuclease